MPRGTRSAPSVSATAHGSRGDWHRRCLSPVTRGGADRSDEAGRRWGQAPRGARPRQSSTPEVPAAGEDHRRAGLADGGEDLVVALRAARLDDRARCPPRARSRGRRRTGRTRRRRARRPRASARARGPSRPRSAPRRRGSSGPRRCRGSGRRARSRSRSSVCLTTVQAKRRSSQSPRSTPRRRRRPSRRAGRRSPSRSCTSMPPSTRFKSHSRGVEGAPLEVVEDARRPASGRAPRPRPRRSRGEQHLDELLAEPLAERRARPDASSRRRRRRPRPDRPRAPSRTPPPACPPTPTPHGFACLTITQAGPSSSSASRRAAERSLRLLNESGLPLSCSTRASRCVRAPRSE